MTVKSIIFSQLRAKFSPLGIVKINLTYNCKDQSCIMEVFNKENQHQKHELVKSEYNIIKSMLIDKIIEKINFTGKFIVVRVNLDTKEFYLFSKLDENSKPELIENFI